MSNKTINNVYSNGYCQYRLPCGYCKELGKDCPKNYTTINTYHASASNDDNILTSIKNGDGLTKSDIANTNYVGVYQG